MAEKPLHIEDATRDDLLSLPGIGNERARCILSKRTELNGMTTLDFVGLGFPSNCVDTILNCGYIQFSEPIAYESPHMNVPPGFMAEQQLFQSNMSPQSNHFNGH